jgi:RNA polymerase sigma-70 factor (ECF subfamily)
MTFATTRWSLIAAARDAGIPAAREALAELCRLYWYPLYAYVRRRGHDHDAAQDLTQGFFARLLERQDWAAVDPERGRFRSFLLAACQHFLANEHDREHSRKRGGGQRLLSLDFADADGRYLREPSHDQTPERLFERRWALTLLEQVLAGLQEEYESAGKGPQFEALKGSLAGPEVPYAAVAEELGMSEGAVKVAAHRLRQRYRDRLRATIADTVADEAQVDEELRDLFAALGG